MERDIGHREQGGLGQPSEQAAEPHPEQSPPALHSKKSGVALKPFQFLMDLSRFGDVVPFDGHGYGPAYFVNHPEYVAQVLNSQNYQRAALLQRVIGRSILATDGPAWQRRRRLMAPVFLQKRVEDFGPLIGECTDAMLDRWQSYAQHGESVAASDELTRLILTIIGKSLFSVDLSEQAYAIMASVAAVNQDLGESACSLFGTPVLYTPTRLQQFRAAMKTLDETAHELIATRRRMTTKPKDLLSLLMEVQDPATGKGLTDQDVRDEVVTMLITGHETTAMMLSWALHLLGTHPEAEQRFYDEIDGALEGRKPTVPDLPRLPYTYNVLQESTRLYPPLWQLSRKAVADDVIGECPIPAGAAVVVSAYTLHRHPDYWDQPERFLPERFSRHRTEIRDRKAFIPFGVGPHYCIGGYFAMMEAQLILAAVAQRYRLHLVPGHPVEPEAHLTLRPRHGVQITLEPRQFPIRRAA